MKQLEQHIKDEVVITEDKQVIKQTKFIGTIKPQPGQKVWEIDFTTNKISPAPFDSISINFDGSSRKKLVIRPSCLYTVAINEKNAKKKFIKIVAKLLKR